MNIQKYVTLGIEEKFPYIVVDKKGDVELSIGIEDKKLYITFLGSITAKDWLHNFMFWKKPYKRMSNTFFVHAGFLKIYKIARPIIHEWLDKYEFYDEIIILGHSLGGAIATLCREDVAYLAEKEKQFLQKKKIKCVVSGSPRVFGCLFDKIPQERCKDIFRVVYKNDSIPRLPPTCFLYEHVGCLIQSGKQGLGFLVPSGVYCHSIKRYKEYENLEPSTKNNNELYELSTKIYKYIYIGIGTLFCLISLILLF